MSRDLRNWKRVANRDVFIGVQPWDGEIYDTAQLLLCGRPSVREDLGEIWVYYNACRFRCHKKDLDESYAEYFQDKSALSLSRIRLDGFVSVDAEDEMGSLVTRPFRFDGSMLTINAAARGGLVGVAVIDESGLEYDGYSLQECALFDGDSVRHDVTWREKLSLEELRGRVVRLKFYLRSAKLYSFVVHD